MCCILFSVKPTFKNAASPPAGSFQIRSFALVVLSNEGNVVKDCFCLREIKLLFGAEIAGLKLDDICSNTTRCTRGRRPLRRLRRRLLRIRQVRQTARRARRPRRRGGGGTLPPRRTPRDRRSTTTTTIRTTLPPTTAPTSRTEEISTLQTTTNIRRRGGASLDPQSCIHFDQSERNSIRSNSLGIFTPGRGRAYTAAQLIWPQLMGHGQWANHDKLALSTTFGWTKPINRAAV